MKNAFGFIWLTLLLSACGGGASSNETAQGNSPSTPSPSPAPTPISTPSRSPSPVPSPSPTPLPSPSSAAKSDQALCDDAARVAESGSDLDNEVRELITDAGLLGDPRVISVSPCLTRELPDISEPIAQLGKALFFSKSLSGDFDVACASCHHPELGGADAMSLPVGVEAIDPSRLGPTRTNAAGSLHVPRNSPTTLNTGMWDAGLFWDSRVESLSKVKGQNGASGGLSTPDSSHTLSDTNAIYNLPSAQARFPVLSRDEMLGESFAAGSTDAQSIRNQLAGRLGGHAGFSASLDTDAWLAAFERVCDDSDLETLPDSFQLACNSRTPQELISFDHIVYAIAEYERSQVFVDTPWRDYVQGDLSAISESAKRGALFFYRDAESGGADCGACHSGDFFTDEKHYAIAFPQIGIGHSEAEVAGDDLGRFHVTGNNSDRYAFKTSTLLNIELSEPYGHAGSYQDLEGVIRHYANPRSAIDEYFEQSAPGWCQLQQFYEHPECETLFPLAVTATERAFQAMRQAQASGDNPLPEGVELSASEIEDIVHFMESLTDPCLKDEICLEPWLPEPDQNGPDGNQLNFTFEEVDLSPTEPDVCVAESDENLANDTIFYSKAFTWMTSNSSNFNYLPEGKLYNFFGFAYFRYIEGPDFVESSGTGTNFRNIASILSLELLTRGQREQLMTLVSERLAIHAQVLAKRSEVIDVVEDWRSRAPTSSERNLIRQLSAEATELELQVSILDALAFRNLKDSLSQIQIAAYSDFRKGQLSSLPLEDGVLGEDSQTNLVTVRASDTVRNHTRESGYDSGANKDGLNEVASKFFSWITGSNCKNDYLADGRISNYFGFAKFRVDIRAHDPLSTVSNLRANTANAVIDAIGENQASTYMNQIRAPIESALANYYQSRELAIDYLDRYLNDVDVSDNTALELLAQNITSAGSSLGEADAAIFELQAEVYAEIYRGMSSAQKSALNDAYAEYVGAP